MTAHSVPLVSVVIPTYNAESTIIRCLESVVYQRGPFRKQIIVYDDMSTDNTLHLIDEHFSDLDYIKVIHSTENKGSGYSRQQALSFCTGNFIAFLDSDDFWLPSKLRLQLQDFENSCPNMVISYSSFICISQSKAKLTNVPAKLFSKNIRFINHIPMSSALFRASILNYLDYPAIRLRNDYLFWFSILSLSPSFYALRTSSQPFFIYGSDTGISSNKISLLFKQYKLYRQYFSYSRVLSLYGVFLNVCRRLFS